MTPRAVLISVALLAAGLSASEGARAEEVVLASGPRYDAVDVEFVGESVRFTYLVGTGRATVTIPKERLQPRNLFHLILARTARDPQAQLALGWQALALGLLPDAAHRFHEAAKRDPALAPERDRGLRAIEDRKLEAVLASAEADLRRGRFETGLAKVAEVKSRALPGSDLVRRADGLAELSKRIDEAEGRRIADEATAKAKAFVDAQGAALDAAFARADKAILSAIERRDRVAKPGLSSSRVQSELDAAETLLREGRRILASVADVAGPRGPEVDARDAEALPLLVATHLDLSDLHRVRRRFPSAREHVRAALVLDPQNVRAIEAQRLIEEAARPLPEPYGPEPFDGTYGWGYGTYGRALFWPVHRPRSHVTYRPRSGFSTGGTGWRFGW
jgi:tetratricopeptide (TPR) repeat protein